MAYAVWNMLLVQINTAFNTFRGLRLNRNFKQLGLDKLLYIQKDKVELKLYT